MCVDINYRYKKLNYIQSCKAEPTPPLGTVLGNLGVIPLLFVIILIYLQQNCLYIFY